MQTRMKFQAAGLFAIALMSAFIAFPAAAQQAAVALKFCRQPMRSLPKSAFLTPCSPPRCVRPITG